MNYIKNKFYMFLTLATILILMFMPITNSQTIITDDCECGFEDENFTKHQVSENSYNILKNSDELNDILLKNKLIFTDLTLNSLKIYKIDNNYDKLVVTIPIKNEMKSIIVIIYNEKIIEIVTFDLDYNFNIGTFDLNIIFSNNLYKTSLLKFGNSPIYINPIFYNNEVLFDELPFTTANEWCKIIGLMAFSGFCFTCGYLTALNEKANLLCFLCGVTTTNVFRVCDALFPIEEV